MHLRKLESLLGVKWNSWCDRAYPSSAVSEWSMAVSQSLESESHRVQRFVSNIAAVGPGRGGCAKRGAGKDLHMVCTWQMKTCKFYESAESSDTIAQSDLGQDTKRPPGCLLCNGSLPTTTTDHHLHKLHSHSCTQVYHLVLKYHIHTCTHLD